MFKSDSYGGDQVVSSGGYLVVSETALVVLFGDPPFSSALKEGGDLLILIFANF